MKKKKKDYLIASSFIKGHNKMLKQTFQIINILKQTPRTRTVKGSPKHAHAQETLCPFCLGPSGRAPRALARPWAARLQPSSACPKERKKKAWHEHFGSCLRTELCLLLAVLWFFMDAAVDGVSKSPSLPNSKPDFVLWYLPLIPGVWPTHKLLPVYLITGGCGAEGRAWTVIHRSALMINLTITFFFSP